MNLFYIAINYLKQNLKRPLSLILLVLGPVVLIFIMAKIFSGLFSMGPVSLDMKMGYYSKNQDNVEMQLLKQGLADFGITLEQVETPEQGKNRVADSEYRALIIFNEKNLELIVNDNTGAQAGIIEGLLNNFLNRYNLYTVLTKYEPEILTEVINAQAINYITQQALDAPRQPRALDFFGIIILTMTVLLGGNLGSYGIVREKIQKTIYRFYVAPVRKAEYLMGMFCGIFISLILQIAVVFIIGKYIMNIYYGENILPIAVLLICECFFALALGMGIGGLVKDPKTAGGILSALLPLLIFLGGGYMKLPDNVPVLNFFRQLSPLDWINKALFEQIYTNQQTLFLPAIFICLIAGLFILGISGFVMLRREKV